MLQRRCLIVSVVSRPGERRLKSLADQVYERLRLDIVGGNLAPGGAVLPLLNGMAHLDALEEKMREMAEMQRALKRLVSSCHGDDDPHCAILDELAVSSPDAPRGQLSLYERNVFDFDRYIARTLSGLGTR